MKILFVDIETAPNLVHVWGLWNQNVGTNQIIDAGYVMCFAAKWYGEDTVYFERVNPDKPKAALQKIHKLLDQADAVVHYNGTKFDVPTLNKEFVLNGMPPPSPYKQIDLYRVAKDRFRFASNKLDYVAKSLGVGEKLGHAGHSLWIRCLAGERAAWSEMEAYNRNDVILLEKVYEVLKPWIKGHANRSLFDEALVCPNCGSIRWQRRGFHYTSTQKYQRYNCTECGNWFRGGRSLAKSPAEKFVNIS